MPVAAAGRPLHAGASRVRTRRTPTRSRIATARSARAANAAANYSVFVRLVVAGYVQGEVDEECGVRPARGRAVRRGAGVCGEITPGLTPGVRRADLANRRAARRTEANPRRKPGGEWAFATQLSVRSAAHQ